MLKIGVCDDEDYQREHIAQLCEQYAQEKKILCEIEQFCSGQEVLEYTGERLILLFLDIEMDGMGGLQVMKELEQSGQVWRIVFISSHQESVFDAFGVKTLGFQVKPVCSSDLEKWIEIAMRENQEDVVLKFRENKEEFWYPVSSVVYLEAEGSYVKVHTRSREFCVSRNLKYWEEKLPKERMVRSHKSYIINLEHICEINGEIRIKGEENALPVGRKYKKDLEEKYQRFLKKRIRGRIE